MNGYKVSVNRMLVCYGCRASAMKAAQWFAKRMDDVHIRVTDPSDNVIWVN